MTINTKAHFISSYYSDNKLLHAHLLLVILLLISVTVRQRVDVDPILLNFIQNLGWYKRFNSLFMFNIKLCHF